MDALVENDITDVDDHTGLEQLVGEHVLHERPSDVPNRNQEGKIGHPDLLQNLERAWGVLNAAWRCEVQLQAQPSLT